MTDKGEGPSKTGEGHVSAVSRAIAGVKSIVSPDHIRGDVDGGMRSTEKIAGQNLENQEAAKTKIVKKVSLDTAGNKHFYINGTEVSEVDYSNNSG